MHLMVKQHTSLTPNPLSKNSINLVDNPKFTTKPTWCYEFELPHSPKSCAVALSFPGNQTMVENVMIRKKTMMI